MFAIHCGVGVFFSSYGDISCNVRSTEVRKSRKSKPASDVWNESHIASTLALPSSSWPQQAKIHALDSVNR